MSEACSEPEQDPLLARMLEVERAEQERQRRARDVGFPSPRKVVAYHQMLADAVECPDCRATAGAPCRPWPDLVALHGARVMTGEAALRLGGRWQEPDWWGER